MTSVMGFSVSASSPLETLTTSGLAPASAVKIFPLISRTA